MTSSAAGPERSQHFVDTPHSHRHCPVGHALALLGDRWSMLIVREVLGGLDRYQEIRDSLKISDHTFTRRLTHLQDIGVILRDEAKAGRYQLTPAGEDLARVLAVLGDWAMHWFSVEPPLRRPSEPVILAAEELGFDVSNRFADINGGTS